MNPVLPTGAAMNHREHDGSVSRIVAVGPLTLDWPGVHGHVIPVRLECGYTYGGNATMNHRIGDLTRCSDDLLTEQERQAINEAWRP